MSKGEPPDLPPDVIARALDGESDAFRLFHDRYDPTVRWAVGLRVYRWPQLVPQYEDIVQEVWLALVRDDGKRLRYHDAERGVPFHRFLALVCARYGWKVAKRELDHPTDEIGDVIEDDDGGFFEKLMDADLLERLTDRVERSLGDTDRMLFEGYYIQGEKLKDVGARLGMNENATYKRKERLQKKIQGIAEDLLKEPPGSTPPDLVAVVLGLLFVVARASLGGGT